ncbi:trace amine-associated receptor 7b-like [Lethenteron reissneri]|uniref:trace amine-associated receptor 7b-like n=1 Tax=Lethenteron reissneri TaxID=7753 RepID=UPI002AB692D9|nr:trace amine-associated receptor 7b-like [Lethenteron reissneri]
MKTHNATNTSVAPVCVVTFFNFNCSPPDLGDGERDILIGGFSLVIATTALGNILTITSILYFRQLQTRTNAFAISLATADLLVGVMVMPYAVTRTAYTCWFYGKTFCKMHTWFDYTLTTSSILHLACISIDRYVAISDPLRYEQRVTKKLVGRMLVFCWTSFIIYGLSYMLEWNIAGIEDIVASSTCPHNCPVFMNVQFALTNTLCAYVTPMLLMLAAYAKVYVMARAQARKISIAMLQTRSADAAVRSRWSAMKREHSATKTLGIIMGAFVIFWVPFFVVAASEPLLGYASDPLVWDVANWFTYINSTMNPILFAAFNRSFRNAFYLIVSGKILRGSYRGTDLFSFKRGGGVAEMA